MTRLEVNQLFAEGIEKERYDLGLSQKQMADALDMSLSAYKRMINLDTEKVDIYITYKLYQLTGRTTYDYLGIKDSTMEMQRKLLALSSAQIAFIDSIIEFEKLFAETHEDATDFVTVFIPTGNMEDGMIYDSSNIQKEKFGGIKPKYGVPISCGIKVTSNHLHPVYNMGDILLISRRPIRDGDTGIFMNKENGRAYIRKFYQTEPCKLEPLNGYGETFYVDSHSKEDMDKWIKFGVVVAKIR